MKDPLRNFLDKIKPTFQGKGGVSYYFPIFDVIENLFYSSDKRTKGLNIAKKRAGEAKYNVQYLNEWPLIDGINHPIKKGKPKAIKYPNSRNCFLVIFSVKI